MNAKGFLFGAVGESQKFQPLAQLLPAFMFCLSCFRCNPFPEMVLLRKSVIVVETKEEELENQETEVRC